MSYKYSSLKVELLQYNEQSEFIVSTAAKLCYSASDIKSLKSKIEKESQKDFIANIAEMGHLSVFEHISFTFAVEGVSRALTHQLVRHRVASYSQQSQRYVKSVDGFNHIIPNTIKSNTQAKEKFDNLMKEISLCYDELLGLGIPAEDARYVLPNAAETKIIITMNARELLHFFSVRSCNRAQWEIRELSDKMLSLVYNVAPAIFDSSGPSCVRGRCSEGKFNCGHASQVKKRITNLKVKEK